VPFPIRIGDSAFNLKFDSVVRAVRDRLRRYDSAEACGKWNATLYEDFRSDTRFIYTLDEIFSDVVGRYTNGDCIVSDGLAFETVKIILGRAIDLCVRLDFLDGPHGYGMAPAKFSVANDNTRDNCIVATLCCGLREPDGDFWYPKGSRNHNVVMPDDYGWAYTYTRTYGPPTISCWIERRTQERGEQ
jgi:hypothetical protein